MPPKQPRIPVWIGIFGVYLSVALCVATDAVAADSVAVEFARAQQSFEEGNYRQSADALQRLLDSQLKAQEAAPESIAARRLLAQVYYRSGDYSAAIEAAKQYMQRLRKSDPELSLIAADSNLKLGHPEDAQAQLDQVLPLLKNNASNAQDARLVAEAERIAESVQRAGGKPSVAPTTKLRPPNIPQDERFDVIKLTANRYVESNRLENAIALLSGELTTTAYDASESAELRLLLADCYRRQASMYEESANTSARASSMAAENNTLDSLTKDLSRQREQAKTTEDFFKLLPREGLLHERKAELAHAMAQIESSQNSAITTSAQRQEPAIQHLQQAAKCYQSLGDRVNAARNTNSDTTAVDKSKERDRPARLNQYQDLALCGLQRVYEAMRLSSTTSTNHRLAAALCQTSDQLVAERSQRLLPIDPALYEAKQAQASVYASIDDIGSHKHAAEMYRELVAYWDANPRPQRELQAAALVGLAEMLRATDKTKDAYNFALQANKLVADLPKDDDPISRRDRALLVARIKNSLGVTSIALGEYRDALAYLTAADLELKPYGDRFVDLRRQNEQTLLVLSRVEVYRALLHKAEAKYDEAANRVREGRQLREQIDNNGEDLLAYHLAEASVRLAQARDLMQQQRISTQNAAVREALSEAEQALDRAARLGDSPADREGALRQPGAQLPYRYLRALLSRLRGDSNGAIKSFSDLVQDCEKQSDLKTAAKCDMQLAELTLESLAQAPSKSAALPVGESPSVSRAQAVDLREAKLNRRAEIKRAADFADRAVALFSQMDASPEDEVAVTALPSLHFQASYLAARLGVILATLDSHIARMDELLLAGGSGNTNSSDSPSRDISPSDHRDRAIQLLEDAVRQAERPASSTTQVRLQRARFFSRYAPAYDLLVDLLVSAAVGGLDSAHFEQSAQEFARLRRAIEIADLARNRTFREQIDGWRQTAGNNAKPLSFDWNQHLSSILPSGTTLLIYHLDGPQLLDLGASRSGSDAANTGGGHLFVVSDQGKEIGYYRLRYGSPETKSALGMSRDLAAQLVRRQIGWIENPESTRDWGRAEQRALTNCLLPSDLVTLLTKSGTENATKNILIVTDGALHQLPFESLLLPERKNNSDRRVHYVIDDLPPLRYGPSLSVLARINQDAASHVEARVQILTVGNPAYPANDQQRDIPAWQELLRQIPSATGGFVPLTHSEEECDAVYASFDELSSSGRTKLTQTAATEAAVRKSIADSRLIHIAAHGCVDYQNDNLFGALVFAPGSDPNNSSDDGLLQLREIYSLDFSRCDLAVLSACQTYVGPERPLEAGTSMARAFLEQGAKRVICSQWSTDDRATTDLMKSFFDRLQATRRAGKTIDYADALHEAKLALRRDSERGSTPKYWAPFVLVGAP